MGNKKYNKIILQVFLSVILLVSIINYVIDPYYVFNIHNKLNTDRKYKDKNHRFSKIPAFKLYKNDVCAIWTGSSKSWEGSNEEYESQLLNCNVKNLAISGSSFEEVLTMAKNAIIIHPEIKTIYIGLDFRMMQKVVDNQSETLKSVEKNKLTKEEILPLILSLDTFQDSLRTISRNLVKKKKQKVAYGEETTHNKRYMHKFKRRIKEYNEEQYKNYVIDEKYYEELKNFIKDEKEKGINIIFFTTTMHITERILIENTHNSENFYKVKEKLAEIQPYYDFAIVNGYTTEEVSEEMKCFRDPVHNLPFLRKKLTNKLFNYDSDFGVYITKDNVKEMNKEDEKNFQNYIKQNPEYVKQVQEWSK